MLILLIYLNLILWLFWIEIVTTTKGSSHLKVYDVNQEDTECIIRNPSSDESILKIFVSPSRFIARLFFFFLAMARSQDIYWRQNVFFFFVQTNNKSLKVAAMTDFNKVIVFDIKDKTTSVVMASDIKVSELGEVVAVAPSGDNIVVTGTKSFKIYDEITEETLAYIWDTKKGLKSVLSFISMKLLMLWKCLNNCEIKRLLFLDFVACFHKFLVPQAVK